MSHTAVVSPETAETYPHAQWVSSEYGGVPVANLIQILHLERDFHSRILSTECPNERKRQYHILYEQVHALKRGGETSTDGHGADRLVLTFRKELEGRSVLDVGCGGGHFLNRLAQLLPHGRLLGLDTSAPATGPEGFEFIQQDITSFTVPQQFDTVFSHQVFEHIAPADVPAHLASIRQALVKGGTFIVCLPNKYWGPQDITRIVDNTFRGLVPAQGSHLNESSYQEMIPLLNAAGFHNVRTLIPFGSFIPALRGIRVRPSINMLLERYASLRALSNLVAKGGRPLFKNPIMLVCQRA